MYTKNFEIWKPFEAVHVLMKLLLSSSNGLSNDPRTSPLYFVILSDQVADYLLLLTNYGFK